MNSDFQKDILHENEEWSRVFDREIMKVSNNSWTPYSSYWWENYYDEIVTHVNDRLSIFDDPKILEVGCGSGKASILLGRDSEKVLLDFSKSALDYAKFLIQKFNTQNVFLIEGNMLKLPFIDRNFHYVWNIGTLEHYDEALSSKMLSEMMRVVGSGGIVGVGVPNFSSGPILKAKLLRLPFFSWISGYKLDTERNYSEEQLIKLAEMSSALSNRKISRIEFNYFGNFLPMETPKYILKTIGVILSLLMPSKKFLRFVFIYLD